MRSTQSFIVLLLISLLGVTSCQTTKPTTSQVTTYDEDLSYLRPAAAALEGTDDESMADNTVEKPHVEPQYHIKSELDSVLSTIRASRGEIEFLNGFTVQVYSGNNREQANEIKTQVYETFEEYEPEISYIQPNFKVKIGQFFDRLEANKVYTRVKAEFPKAIVIPERIYFE
ncbi:MAG: SPOR domain-containing protein [Cyclobacteriaceae bacterium]